MTEQELIRELNTRLNQELDLFFSEIRSGRIPPELKSFAASEMLDRVSRLCAACRDNL